MDALFFASVAYQRVLPESTLVTTNKDKALKLAILALGEQDAQAPGNTLYSPVLRFRRGLVPEDSRIYIYRVVLTESEVVKDVVANSGSKEPDYYRTRRTAQLEMVTFYPSWMAGLRWAEDKGDLTRIRDVFKEQTR
jgi:hypothetical protein